MISKPIAMALWGLAFGPVAAQAAGVDDEAFAAAVTVVFIEQCIKSDALLRRTCARAGPNAPERIRASCQLPDPSFEARTAESYRAFRDTNREAITRAETEIARQRAEAEQVFARHFGGLAKGPFTSTDVYGLARAVDECNRLGPRSLAAPRIPASAASPR